MASGRVPRGRQFKKTLNNIKTTVLCGFVTVLVLRGTIGFGGLGEVGGDSSAASDQSVVWGIDRFIRGSGGYSDASNQRVVEDIDRVLREIRFGDFDLDDDDRQQQEQLQLPLMPRGATDAAYTDFSAAANYNLWSKISDWDIQRRRWLSENPGFPSMLDGGKPRILLVTGSPPNPCDNATGDHYLLKGIKNKIDYCRLHGMEIVYSMAHLDPELAGYWAKLPLMRRLMLSHPEVEWIWWMDSDALLTDMAFEVPFSRYSAHNLVVHGYRDLVFNQHSWTGLSTGSFLLRNCQWSLDLLDAWAPMGLKGPIRDEAGKILTAHLKGRPAFEADDQSALIYLLLMQQDRWADKVFLENSYCLHGYWAGLVDRYEEMMEEHHPGLGDERWPFVTHFLGCKPCGSDGDYPAERCLRSMERAFNFADNQVLRMYGFAHRDLSSADIKRTRRQTPRALEMKERFNPEARMTV